MGNTIRREPVTSKIPASPDYKFLNITDFRGIHQTDNPFLAATNTASDCLNVYVDENNALTTRPRIEKMYGLSCIIPDFEKLLFSYRLEKRMLFQIQKQNEEISFVVEDGGIFREINTNALSLSSAHCGVVEQNGNIYVLNEDYYVIKPDNIMYLVRDDVDTYIPTTQTKYIGLTDKEPYLSEEDNILSNKYKVDYYWDLNSDLDEALTKGRVLKNNYIKTYQSEESFLPWGDETQVAMRALNNNMLILDKHGDESPRGVDIYEVSDDNTLALKHEIVQENVFNINKTATAYLYYTSVGGFVLYDMVLNVPRYLNAPSGQSFTTESHISDDGKHFFIVVNNNADSKKSIYQYDYDGDSNSFVGKLIADDVKPNMYISADYQRIISYDSDGSMLLLSDFSTQEPQRIEMTYKDLDGGIVIGFNGAGTKIYVWRNGIEIDEGTIDGSSVVKSKIHYLSHTPSNIFDISVKLSEEEDALYYVVQTKTDQRIVRKYFLDSGKDIKLFETVIPENKISRPFFHTCLSRSGSYWYLTINELYGNQMTITLRRLESSIYPEITVEYEKEISEEFSLGKNIIRFQNQFWYYGDDSLVRWSAFNDATYIPAGNYDNVGSEGAIVDSLVADSSSLILFKKDGFFRVSPTTIGEEKTYLFMEAKSNIGVYAPSSASLSAFNEIPLYVGEKGFYALQQLSDVQSSDHVSQMISANIEPKFSKTHDKDKIFSSSGLYWTYFFIPHNNTTDVWILDDRTGSWYFWTLPIHTVSSWYRDEVLQIADIDGYVYKFTTNDIVKDYGTEYYDDGEKIIPWFWRSQIMSMGTINYSKKLNTTTFIMTDTDETDEYGLNYKFKIFRKLANESNTTTITNKLNYILSVTKKTIIPRFNFLQFELSNIDDDYDNNKLRLIGIGLKYELLAGLM